MNYESLQKAIIITQRDNWIYYTDHMETLQTLRLQGLFSLHESGTSKLNDT